MLAVAASLVFGLAGSASAASSGNGWDGVESTWVPEGPNGTWSIVPNQCPTHPDANIVGEGEGSHVIRTRHGADGVIYRQDVIRGEGTAADQWGNTYSWTYNNAVHDQSSDGGVSWSGTMFDTFHLKGSGPYNINAGFVGHIVASPTAFFIKPIGQHGYPLNFAVFDGAPGGLFMCDPT